MHSGHVRTEEQGGCLTQASLGSFMEAVDAQARGDGREGEVHVERAAPTNQACQVHLVGVHSRGVRKVEDEGAAQLVGDAVEHAVVTQGAEQGVLYTRAYMPWERGGGLSPRGKVNGNHTRKAHPFCPC